MADLPPNMTDYLATRASFRLEVPERYNYARDVVDAWATREPGKLALLSVGPDGGQARRFSFADLAAASDRAARFLAGQGVGKDDRVFVMLPRCRTGTTWSWAASSWGPSPCRPPPCSPPATSPTG